MKNRKPSRVQRRVAAMFSDSYHTLHMVEVMATVRQYDLESRPRVDRVAVELAARTQMREEDRDDRGLQLVGILVADLAPVVRGRIMWAEEVEPTRAEL